MSFKNRLTKAIYVLLGITNYKGNTFLKNLTLAVYKHRKSKQTAQPYEYLLRKRDLNGVYSFSHPHWQFDNGIELLEVGEDEEYYETLRKEEWCDSIYALTPQGWRVTSTLNKNDGRQHPLPTHQKQTQTL